MKSSITAHMVVRNEEQWIWFAIMSVLPYVQKILVFDTGSTDKTIQILKSIKSNKIELMEKGEVSPSQLVDLRNEQLIKTRTAWFMILDGDEVWSEEGMKEVISKTSTASPSTTALVSRCLVPVGDLFHLQSDRAGKYRILEKQGHFNIRLYRKKDGSTWKGIYPLEAYVDNAGVAVQNKSKEIDWLKIPYWHMSLLKRTSAKSHRKRKLEIGGVHKQSLPEIFYDVRPDIVPSPWTTFSETERLQASLLTPLYTLKRDRE